MDCQLPAPSARECKRQLQKELASKFGVEMRPKYRPARRGRRGGTDGGVEVQRLLAPPGAERYPVRWAYWTATDKSAETWNRYGVGTESYVDTVWRDGAKLPPGRYTFWLFLSLVHHKSSNFIFLHSSSVLQRVLDSIHQSGTVLKNLGTANPEFPQHGSKSKRRWGKCRVGATFYSLEPLILS